MTRSKSSSSIGVCVFAFNEEAEIANTLKSVADHNGHNGSILEICVVDDGSEDKTAHIVLEESASNPSIKLVRHESNRGPTEALRTGLNALDTDYVLLLPGDHTYDYEAIETILDLRRTTEESIGLVLGSRGPRRMRRSRSREFAADLARLPFRLYQSGSQTLPNVGLILFPRKIGMLMPEGVVGYGQGIGLLGTMLCAGIGFAHTPIDQVPGSQDRGSKLTLRRVVDVGRTHWALLRGRKYIRAAASDPQNLCDRGADS